MERVKLMNGKVESYPTSENDTWKFYLCDTFENAAELKHTLELLGNHCEIDDNSRGWFVRVKK